MQGQTHSDVTIEIPPKAGNYGSIRNDTNPLSLDGLRVLTPTILASRKFLQLSSFSTEFDTRSANSVSAASYS